MGFLYVLVLVAVFLQKEALSTSDTPMCSSCGGGYCTSDNGCSCYSDVTATCVPESECAIVGTNICCPTGYYWSSADNCCTATLICNPSCQNDQICKNVNGVATCGCNTALYSGMNTSSIAPLVKCESSVMTVSLSKCLLEALGYDSTTFQLNNNSDSCVNTYTQTISNVTMQSIQALPQTGWCGNEVANDSLKVYYSNVLHIGIQNKSIITVNPTNISFSCSYNLTMQTSLAAAFKPSFNTVNISVSGEGSILTTMAAYWDQQYTTPVQDNQDVPVGSNIYLGIFSDAQDVSKFVLRTESCYATPDNNVNNVNRVAIVLGGCPANQGITAQVQENGVSLESRIQFNSFAFQGQPLVYITCQVRMCDKNTTCTGCGASRSNGDDGTAMLQIPLNFLDDFSSSASNTVVSSRALLVSSFLVYLSVKLF
ncbi:pancreatic secretory granule membrane major glycoprotein GP2-like [Hyla sarda]|uniref:pancreatic secretory granule membrane major glycoprotein GP2-like n=1 Tax=Hyla sarda TaxID=327740 RepID=UPI0024C3B57E|nr:pancreatic secretory granule membrane major glycoprotein GP2-like [Hyla sarda]